MKKLLIAFLLLTGINICSQAQSCGASGPPQCTPSGTLTQPGFSPSYDSLPPLINGIASNSVIQFKNFDTIMFAGNVVTVQSLRFDSIENLPPGLCWATN